MRALGSLVVAMLGASAAFAVDEAAPHAPPGADQLSFYVGTLPCADCSGIRTELTMFERGYCLKETRLGQIRDATAESHGTWLVGAGPRGTTAPVYRLIEDRSDHGRVFLKVSDDEFQMGDREGRPIGSDPSHTLRRQPVKPEPAPHPAPPGQFLLGFYTGTLQCADCQGVRLELSLFDGRAAGARSYWLRQTHPGRPESEAAVEAGGGWRAHRGSGGLVIELSENTEQPDRLVFEERGSEELELVQRSGQRFSGGGGTIGRRVAARPGARWHESIGCRALTSGGIDSVAGSVDCGGTVIGYDIGGMAGDWCAGRVAVHVSSIGQVPMKICSASEGPRPARMNVSLPTQVVNLFVEGPTPDDTMVLLAVARHLARQNSTLQEWHDRGSNGGSGTRQR